MRTGYLVLLLIAPLLAACGSAFAPDSPGGHAASTATPNPAGGSSRLAVGQSAPEFTATDLDGRPVTLQAWRGHPVWINFWATWCPPCKAEMPVMEEKYRQYQDRGLQILGIDLQESPEAVRAWVQGQFHWRFVIDDGTLANRFDLEGVPMHIFIDRAGVVRSIHVGDLTPAGMDAGLATILNP